MDFLNGPPKKVIEAWDEPELPPIEYDLEQEAQHSTWIEGETDYRSALDALKLTWKGVDIDFLREAHRILMRDRPTKFPGNFRPVNVRVGAYVAPGWEHVPTLMYKLNTLLQSKSIPPLLKAVWGHFQFESIHPFADGNGRIGRLLVNRLLDRPWSPAVLSDRPRYYQLLDNAEWEPWKDWMLQTLRNPQ